MSATTRGSLPPGVYWRRRLFVGLLALSIVFVAASMLGSGSDGSSGDDPVAQQAGAESTAATSAPTTPPQTKQSTSQKKKQKRQQKKQLAEPSGTCAPADIRVVSSTKKAVAGQPVELDLRVKTRTNPACHWKVGKRRLAVRVTGDDGEVWSTRHCAEGIPSQALVLRNNAATTITVTWDSRRSDDGCPEDTEWVLPGEYAVTTAALGGEPAQQPLTLVAPEAPPPEPDHTAEHRTGNALDRMKKRNR